MNETCGDCKYHRSNWKDEYGKNGLLPCDTEENTEAWSNDCFERS